MQRQPSLWPRYLTLSLIAFAALVALSLAAPEGSTDARTNLAGDPGSLRLEATPGEEGGSFSLAAEKLVVTNLVGGIEVLPAGGTEFEVDVRFHGADSQHPLRVHTREGKTAEVAVVFPVDQVRRYRYEGAGRLSTNLSLPLRGREKASSWLSALFREFSGDRVEVSSQKGEALYADMTIRVPRGKTLDLVLGAGKIHAVGVTGDLSLDSSGGPIEVTRVEGSVVADTGSGSITGDNLQGAVNFDTGSGSVQLHNARGPSIRVDTGSGSVALADVDGETIDVDTGSGTVRADRLGADNLVIDTGSGEVGVSLVRLGNGSLEIDTGSGSVSMNLPRDASARIKADTGSGGIRLDLEDVTYRKKERGYVEATVGNGDATIAIDTGSGGVTIGYT